MRIVEVTVLTLEGARSTLVTTLARPAMFGSTRGATVGLMVGIRVSILRFGVRMMLCANAAGVSRYTSGNAAMTKAIATYLFFTCRPSSMGSRLAPLRRGFREIDDLLAAQLADQACDFVLAHRLAAELQAEQAIG